MSATIKQIYKSNVIDSYEYYIEIEDNQPLYFSRTYYPMYPYGNFTQDNYWLWKTKKSGWFESETVKDNWNGSGSESYPKRSVSISLIDDLTKKANDVLKEINELESSDDKDITIMEFIDKAIEDLEYYGDFEE